MRKRFFYLVMVPRGIIFDLDGTLVDSRLDFDAMREEMDLAAGLPILEAIEQLPQKRAAQCQAILARHEAEGAQRATLMPGVITFLEEVERRNIRRAVVTRNARQIAVETLDRLELRFDYVLGREDAPVKPHPGAIWKICELWGLPPGEVIIIGDYLFDLLAGRSAGVRTVLYTAGEKPAPEFEEHADIILNSFFDASGLLGEGQQ